VQLFIVQFNKSRFVFWELGAAPNVGECECHAFELRSRSSCHCHSEYAQAAKGARQLGYYDRCMEVGRQNKTKRIPVPGWAKAKLGRQHRSQLQNPAFEVTEVTSNSAWLIFLKAVFV
jgi:hypothetical protein